MRPLIGITADSDGPFFRLRRDYPSAVTAAGGIPLVLVPVYDAISHIAEVIDGLLISGGDDLLPEYCNEVIEGRAEMKFVEKERTDFETALLREIIKREKPVLGICYGLQLINVAFGGTIYQDIGCERREALDHKKIRHVITASGPFIEFLGLLPQKFETNSNHHQAVKKLGSGLEVFAEAEDGIIEGIYCPHYPFLAGVQWHPERECDTLSLKILTSFIKRAKTNREQSASVPVIL